LAPASTLHSGPRNGSGPPFVAILLLGSVERLAPNRLRLFWQSVPHGFRDVRIALIRQQTPPPPARRRSQKRRQTAQRLAQNTGNSGALAAAHDKNHH